jgi:preprotein translocase subunit YajC
VQDFAAVLPFVVLALLFWLFLVRPQARRRRELMHMQSTLEVGDEVMLTSGVYGTVRGLDEDGDVARVEIAAGVTIKVARGAIGQVVKAVDRPADADADHGEVPEEN